MQSIFYLELLLLQGALSPSAVPLSSLAHVRADHYASYIPKKLLFSADGTCLACAGARYSELEVFDRKWKRVYSAVKQLDPRSILIDMNRSQAGFNWWWKTMSDDYFDFTQTYWQEAWPNGSGPQEVSVSDNADWRDKSVLYGQLIKKSSALVVSPNGAGILDIKTKVYSPAYKSESNETGYGVRYINGSFVRWDRYFAISKNLASLFDDGQIIKLTPENSVDPGDPREFNRAADKLIVCKNFSGYGVSLPDGKITKSTGWREGSTIISSAISSPLVIIGYVTVWAGTGIGTPVDSIAFLDARNLRVVATVKCCEVKLGQYDVGAIAISPNGKEFAFSIGNKISILKVPAIVLSEIDNPKHVENVDRALKTLVWDGRFNLGGQ